MNTKNHTIALNNNQNSQHSYKGFFFFLTVQSAQSHIWRIVWGKLAKTPQEDLFLWFMVSTYQIYHKIGQAKLEWTRKLMFPVPFRTWKLFCYAKYIKSTFSWHYPITFLYKYLPIYIWPIFSLEGNITLLV